MIAGIVASGRLGSAPEPAREGELYWMIVGNVTTPGKRYLYNIKLAKAPEESPSQYVATLGETLEIPYFTSASQAYTGARMVSQDSAVLLYSKGPIVPTPDNSPIQKYVNTGPGKFARVADIPALPWSEVDGVTSRINLSLTGKIAVQTAGTAGQQFKIYRLVDGVWEQYTIIGAPSNLSITNSSYPFWARDDSWLALLVTNTTMGVLRFDNEAMTATYAGLVMASGSTLTEGIGVDYANNIVYYKANNLHPTRHRPVIIGPSTLTQYTPTVLDAITNGVQKVQSNYDGTKLIVKENASISRYYTFDFASKAMTLRTISSELTTNNNNLVKLQELPDPNSMILRPSGLMSPGILSASTTLLQLAQPASGNMAPVIAAISPAPNTQIFDDEGLVIKALF